MGIEVRQEERFFIAVDEEKLCYESVQTRQRLRKFVRILRDSFEHKRLRLDDVLERMSRFAMGSRTAPFCGF